MLKTFSEITGIEMQYPPTLEGSVTLEIKDMPWDEVFELILRQNNLTHEMKGKTIVILPE